MEIKELEESEKRKRALTLILEKTKEETLSKRYSKEATKASILEKTVWITSNFDIRTYCKDLTPEEKEYLLTDKQTEELRKSISKNKQAEEYTELLIKYITGNGFEVRVLNMAFEAYQKHCRELLSYLAIKEQLEKECKDLTLLYSGITDPKERERFEKSVLKLNREGVMFGTDGTRFSLVYLTDGKLINDIMEARSKIVYTLRAIRANIETLIEFYGSEHISLFPIHLSVNLTEFEGESFLRSIPEALPYLRSKILEKKERGESVSKEEEEWGVFPDISECVPTELDYIFAKNSLSLAGAYERMKILYED